MNQHFHRRISLPSRKYDEVNGEIIDTLTCDPKYVVYKSDIRLHRPIMLLPSNDVHQRLLALATRDLNSAAC